MSFEDEPQNPRAKKEKDPYKQLKHIHTRLQPAMLPFIEKLSKFVCKQNKKLIVSEAYETPRPIIRQMYDRADSVLYSTFNFSFVGLPWSAEKAKYEVDSYYVDMDETHIPSFVLGNHDVHRVASRYTDLQARALAVIQFTLRGVPYVYYGEEIGMQDNVIPPDKIHDPRELQVPGKGLGRDPVRTPMQWDNTDNAGFSQSEPWLPLHNGCKETNVSVQKSDSQSFLELYKELISLRNTHMCLRYGSYRRLSLSNPDIFGFQREGEDEIIRVYTNFSDKKREIEAEEPGILCCSSYMDCGVRTELKNSISLRKHESIVILHDKEESNPIM
jgi:alpha-glucosidase